MNPFFAGFFERLSNPGSSPAPKADTGEGAALSLIGYIMDSWVDERQPIAGYIQTMLDEAKKPDAEWLKDLDWMQRQMLSTFLMGLTSIKEAARARKTA